MQVFVIHRTFDREKARQELKRAASERQIDVIPLILDNSKGDEWKSRARKAIENSEAVVVFDIKACLESENATWEMQVASDLNKPRIVLDPPTAKPSEIDKLEATYHHDQEFDSYFKQKEQRFIVKKEGTGKEKDKDIIELYKVMVTSSEQLIQRRQSMNAFFIAAIGSLLAFAGALVKFGSLESRTISILVIGVLGITGLILCHSWHNLIDNYGKLNKAKFRVITKLESMMSARVFSAEWAALGKGNRPSKYQSFTTTEKNVPKGFASLIFVLLALTVVWYQWPADGIDKDATDRMGTVICNSSVTIESQKESKPPKKVTQKRKACPPANGQVTQSDSPN